jgi:hypothetical protein
VRSPVANLQDVDGKITVEAVANTLARRFGEDAGEYEELDDSAATAADRDSVEQAIRKWTSWEWLFGGSPEFTVRLGENSGEGILELVVRGGTVAAAHELAPEPTELLELLGVRFGPETRTPSAASEPEGRWRARRRLRPGRNGGRKRPRDSSANRPRASGPPPYSGCRRPFGRFGHFDEEHQGSVLRAMNTRRTA